MLPVSLPWVTDCISRDVVPSCSDGAFDIAARIVPRRRVRNIFFVRPHRYRPHTKTPHFRFGKEQMKCQVALMRSYVA